MQRRLAHHKQIDLFGHPGAPSPHPNTISLRDELHNEIPSTTYLTHGIHNFYPAKFIPQVPRFVINQFQLRNKTICDPFAGSGTTAVECLITGNSNVSNDINPLTRFLIEVKTLKMNPNQFFEYSHQLGQQINLMNKSRLSFLPDWKNIAYWYPERILTRLVKIWGVIHNSSDLLAIRLVWMGEF